MNNDENDNKIAPNTRTDITVFDSSLARRGLELINKPGLKEIIQLGNRISTENASQVSRITQIGEGALRQITWSSDGRLLVAATLGGIYVFDTENFEEEQFIETPAISVSISSDSKTLASASPSGKISIWKIENWTAFQEFETSDGINSLLFSPDGRLLASSSDEQVVRLWSTANGALLTVLEGDSTTEKDSAGIGFQDKYRAAIYLLRHHHRDHLDCISFSPDASLLAFGSLRNIFIWRVEDGTLYTTIGNHDDRILSVAFSPDGSLIASGEEYHLSVWSVSDGAMIWRQDGIDLGNVFPRIKSLSFSRNGDLLASAGADRNRNHEVRVWNVADGNLIMSLDEHESILESVAFSPDGKLLAAGSEDGNVSIWEVGKNSLHKRISNRRSSSVFCVDVSPDGTLLASGSADKKVRISRIMDGQLLLTLNGVLPITSIAFSPDGNLIASGQSVFGFSLWHVSDGSLMEHWGTNDGIGQLNTFAFSPDGTILASDGKNHSILLWQVTDGTLMANLEEAGTVSEIAFSPNGSQVASGSLNGEVCIWGVRDGMILQVLSRPSHWSQRHRIAYSPDGSIIASASQNSIYLWDTTNGSLLRVLEQVSGRFISIAFSPDGSILATGNQDDYQTKLWRVSDGILLKSLTGHYESVQSMRFSSNGKLLITGSEDGTIRLWGVAPL